MANKSYKRSLSWLYGGNYQNEQIEIFNKIFSLFGSLATLEKEEVFIVLRKLLNDDRFRCLEEEEALNFISNRIPENKGGQNENN